MKILNLLAEIVCKGAMSSSWVNFHVWHAYITHTSNSGFKEASLKMFQEPWTKIKINHKYIQEIIYKKASVHEQEPQQKHPAESNPKYFRY